MHCRSLIHIVGLAAALLMGVGSAAAFDDSKYPNLKGQWDRFVVRGLPGQPSFDAGKAWGKGQEAPLTAEYQAVLETNLKSLRNRTISPTAWWRKSSQRCRACAGCL